MTYKSRAADRPTEWLAGLSLPTWSTGFFEVNVKLNNAGHQALYQDRFTVPKLDVKHTGDLVYDTGRDVRFEMSTSYGEEKGFSDVDLSLDSPIYGPRRMGRRAVEQSERRKYLKNEESVVTVLTSVYNVSGFLRIALAFNDPDATLISKLEVKRTFVVRHRNQTGPYPVDFVRFTEGRQRPDLEINYKSEVCQIGSNCSLRCDAVGEITSMQVTQQSVEDGQWEPVENTSELVFDYSRSVDWTIQPTATWENMRFQCIAHTSDTNNASLQLQVQFYTEEFYIDANRSNIVVTPDETYPDVKHVTVNCTVVGRPVTYTFVDLRFGQGRQVEYHHLGIATHVPISLEETVETSSTSLGPHTTSIEHLTGARCHSRSLGEQHRYREVEHEMDWPQSQITSTSN
ncbi:hypothetical protein ElyMa_005343900 [Elysia marginata]|uniref:Ig-like domain-containing protein n=1 Tax=Elysia marginata TaxID=1093978 RepID=A0AAV4E9D9_9GAST|nr:hypothetical protein ElyMa_005343900 [Elysia marginata]